MIKQNKLELIILAALVAFFVLALYQIAVSCFQPNQMDYGEGYFLYQAKMWFNGWNWDISNPPYTVMIYGPIFPTIFAIAIKIFGQSLIVGRLICLIATFATTVFIYLIAWQLTQRKLIALIAALFPFALPFYRGWILQLRADVVAIMFAVIGLYLILKYAGRKLEYLSILFFMAAFFTKQIDITIPIAVVLYLLYKRHLRKAAFYSVTMVCAVAFIVLIANLLTDGFFWKQFILFNESNPVTASRAILDTNYTVVFVPIIFLLVFICLPVIIQQALQRKVTLFSFWLLVALFLDGFLLCRKGAFINYALELSLSLGLFLAFIIANRDFSLGRALSYYALALTFLLCWLSPSGVPLPSRAYAQRIQEATAIILDSKTPILSENMGLAVNTGKTPYYELFYFTNLAALGYWDQSTILSDLSDGSIEYVVSEGLISNIQPDNTSFAPPVVKAIESHYQLIYASPDERHTPWYSIFIYKYVGAE